MIFIYHDLWALNQQGQCEAVQATQLPTPAWLPSIPSLTVDSVTPCGA